jgi:hypothetical protein
MSGRHARAATEPSGGLGPCCVRGNNAPYGAQGPGGIRKKALTLGLQDRGGLRIRKEKRRGRQASGENLIVLYRGAGRSLERGLHSPAYKELLHLARY